MKKIKEDIIYITEYENKNIAINFSLEEFNDYINSNIQEKQLFINKKIGLLLKEQNHIQE